MYATARVNPEYESETIVDVYTQVWNPKERRVIEGEYRLACWGGSNLMTGKPYVVFTPPDGIPKYSVKQENFYKVFLLAAHVHFLLTGEVDYRPENPYTAYRDLFPPEFGMEQSLPKFATI